jgi:hypothetical protein
VLPVASALPCDPKSQCRLKSSIVNETCALECAAVIMNALECARGFSVLFPIRVTVRNCSMWNERVTTASCAGVCWSDQECAGVGHNLGTNGSGAYWITSVAWARMAGGMVRPRLAAVFRLMTKSKVAG